MGFNPFATVSDYPSMLNKIAAYTFFVALLATCLLRASIAPFDRFLDHFSLPIPLTSGLVLPVGTVLPAFLVALLFRIVKFHDRMSDLFGLRKRFDVYRILYPLALGSGGPVSADRQELLRQHRKQLMADAFYAYASSTKGKAVIDEHAITMALDQWSWYWILVEAQAVVLATAAALFFTHHYLWTIALLSSLLVLLVLQLFIYEACAQYALDEVKLILQDAARKKAVAAQFHALSS